MSDCLFCKIVRNEIPSYTLYEDTETRAFLDIMPCAPGHTMVILKKHGETILDYSKEELAALMETVKKMTRSLQSAFHTDIVTMGINHGEPSGVHHLHVHIIPRFSDDRGGVIQSIVKNESEEDLTSIQEKIKTYIE